MKRNVREIRCLTSSLPTAMNPVLLHLLILWAVIAVVLGAIVYATR